MTLARAIEGAKDGSVKVLNRTPSGYWLEYQDGGLIDKLAYCELDQLAALKAAHPKKFKKEK